MALLDSKILWISKVPRVVLRTILFLDSSNCYTFFFFIYLSMNKGEI